MTDFFRRYIRGTETLPYDDAFSSFGLRLVKTLENQPYTGGIVIDPQDRQGVRLGRSRRIRPQSAAACSRETFFSRLAELR